MTRPLAYAIPQSHHGSSAIVPSRTIGVKRAIRKNIGVPAEIRTEKATCTTIVKTISCARRRIGHDVAIKRRIGAGTGQSSVSSRRVTPHGATDHLGIVESSTAIVDRRIPVNRSVMELRVGNAATNTRGIPADFAVIAGHIAESAAIAGRIVVASHDQISADREIELSMALDVRLQR